MKKVLALLLALFLLLGGCTIFLGAGLLIDDGTTTEASACQNNISAAPAAITLTDPELTADQLHYAALISGVALNKGLSERDNAIGIVTALQESSLSNLTVAVDHDSLGLFQQRPSILNADGTPYWGTPEQLVDPVYAANRFFTELVNVVPERAHLSIAQAAQKVQNSKYPRAYEKWEDLGTRLSAQAYQQAGGASPSGVDLVNCDLPPAAPVVSATIDKVIKAALSQQGLPYIWGGEQPGVGFDCSGLTQWAYAQGGVSIPRVADDQYREIPNKIPPVLPELRPGDLVFTNLDARGPGAGWGHVGMYIGEGKVINAPQTGDVVKVVSIEDFGPKAAARPLP